MNFVNRFFLWILLLPQRFYRQMGADTGHLRAILNTKLMMDDRRVPPMQQMKRKKTQRLPRYATLGTMLFSAIIGVLFLFVFSVGSDYITQLGFYFAFYIFLLAAMLITDFTTVLIDVRDNLIILPKPVNDKTFLLARLLHIVTHISKLVLPMSLPAAIYLAIHAGILAFVSFLPLVVCSTLFTVFLINAVYVIILKLTTPEKFKNIISYFQIFFAITVYGAYQLVPRLFSAAFFNGFQLTHSRVAWLLPPYWFAAGWQYINGGSLTSPLFVYLLLSLLLPMLSIWAVIRFFAPSFNRKLAMIGGSEGGPVTTNRKKNNSTSRGLGGYATRLAGLLTRRGPEQMSFLFTWKLTARSRDFKMKVYPSIGYLFVYLLLFWVRAKEKISLSSFTEQTGPGRYIFTGLIYLSSYSLMMAIYQLIYSEKYKASWIYYVTPVESPGSLLLGALKAMMAKFYLPLVVIISIAAIILNGPSILPNLILSISNQCLTTLIVGYMSLRALPFSQQQSNSIKGSNFLRGMFSMLLPMILFFVHFLAYNNLVVIIILFALSAIAIWLMMDAIRTKNWEQLTIGEYE
ncbi:MAG: hypothetical protein JO301_15785 [Chitinophagaceae bacterium]|nr:hypothetical protein [Chitinophagaceae bacterium]